MTELDINKFLQGTWYSQQQVGDGPTAVLCSLRKSLHYCNTTRLKRAASMRG